MRASRDNECKMKEIAIEENKRYEKKIIALKTCVDEGKKRLRNAVQAEIAMDSKIEHQASAKAQLDIFMREKLKRVNC